MMHLTFAQALSIWSDLCDAMHGRASHGDEAEVYAYRLMARDPAADDARSRLDIDHADVREQQSLAADSLVSLAEHFEEARSVRVLIDAMSPRAWRKWIGDHFDHRVKVRVIGGGR